MNNIDPDSLAEIQALMDAGKFMDALEKILDVLDFNYKVVDDNTLELELDGSSQWVNIEINNELKVGGLDAFGNFNPGTNTISINFSLCTKVGDALLTVLHEVSHATLGGQFGDQNYEDDIIYSVEYSFMLAYKVFLDVEFSPHFRQHLDTQIAFRDPGLLHETPMPEIMERWLPCIGQIIA